MIMGRCCKRYYKTISMLDWWRIKISYIMFYFGGAYYGSHKDDNYLPTGYCHGGIGYRDHGL